MQYIIISTNAGPILGFSGPKTKYFFILLSFLFYSLSCDLKIDA